MEDFSLDDFRKSNLELWNNWAQINAASSTYDLEGFKQGNVGLNPLELAEVGDVAGKTLLHLQCHFGKDTLSWARLGATVTGADFSDKAIELARSLAAEMSIPATFVQSDLYALPKVLQGQFDIVFTSYGAISWLSDIYGWARVASHFLKPGGTLYIADFHPFAYVLDNKEGSDELHVMYPYKSPLDKPLRFETKGNYADPSSEYRGVEYTWNHTLGDIVTAIIQAGMKIEFLHEHHFSVEGTMWKGLEQSEDGYYRLNDPLLRDAVPLLFSIRAIKE
jgi:SAM-dependent methyltransferase